MISVNTHSNFDRALTFSLLAQRPNFSEDFLHFLLLVTAALLNNNHSSNTPHLPRIFQTTCIWVDRSPGCLSHQIRAAPAGWWWSGCRPVEELLVHDGADGAPTLKSDLLLLSSFTSYRQPGTQEHFSLDPSSHLLLIFRWSIHPLSIFSPVALRIFNGCKCALGTERLQSVP